MSWQLHSFACYSTGEKVAADLAARSPTYVTVQQLLTGKSTRVLVPVGLENEVATDGAGYFYYIKSGGTNRLGETIVQAGQCGLVGLEDAAAVAWLVGLALVAVAAFEFMRIPLRGG